ncbi:hypothetical protein WR25_05130 [Diploscapter pachys]|uniref:G-protein coupled receptors family 1 profile domain-containing protein n=1 Tax=Diploscapter pachys TaxID=2018661 RepID=A0A2A2JI83_9BILA|nr:hypothetical protein WR25_05130 [Diploscapter pachys]
MNGISMQVFTYGKKFRSVYISIFVTVMFVVCGWLTTTLTNTFSYALSPDPFVQMVIQIYAGIAVNFGMTCNIFIFYTINHEYRIAIKNLFGWIRQTRQLEMSTSTVQPISSGMNTKGSRDRRKSSRMSTTTTGSVANLEQRKMAWID